MGKLKDAYLEYREAVEEWKESHPILTKIGKAVIYTSAVIFVTKKAVGRDAKRLKQENIQLRQSIQEYQEALDETRDYAMHGDGMIQAIESINRSLQQDVKRMTYEVAKRDQQLRDFQSRTN